MTLFVVLAALMLVAALALLGWPLLRAQRVEGGNSLIVVGALAIVLPLAAALLYRLTSTWNWDPAAIEAASHGGQPSLADMVAKLQDRVRKQPDDLEGWLMLGRTQFVMNNYPGAVDAFAAAYRQSGGKNLQSVVGYGETLVLTDQATLVGKAGELFEEALKLDPANPKALFYGGAAAAAKGHPQLARDRWASLVRQPLPDEVRVAVALRIQQLDEQMQRAPDPEIAKLATLAPNAPAGAVATPVAAAGSAGGAGTVTVRISLSPALAAKVPAGTPLFVLARDPGQPGPPFAAKRFARASLPMDITLTERDAMMPGRTVRDAHALVIVARFSASGQPMAAKGDYYGEVPYDLAHGKTTELVIDKQVP